jgi:hypothetical protein
MTNVRVDRHVCSNTRGDAPELVRIHLATRLVQRQGFFADLERLDEATLIGREVLAAADAVLGIDTIWAERHALTFEVAKAFNADAVVAEVLTAVRRVVGDAGMEG